MLCLVFFGGFGFFCKRACGFLSNPFDQLGMRFTFRFGSSRLSGERLFMPGISRRGCLAIKNSQRYGRVLNRTTPSRRVTRGRTRAPMSTEKTLSQTIHDHRFEAVLHRAIDAAGLLA